MKRSFLNQLSTKVASLFILLFGRIQWNSPPWLARLGLFQKTKPKLFYATFSVLILVFLALFYVYYWYSHLPEPKLVKALITAPKITPLAEELVPDKLTFNFGYGEADNFRSQPVAPITMVGKELNTGIDIVPSIPGKWIWESDTTLVFTPSEDWPAGQTYKVHFTKEVFAPGSKMASYHYRFATKPFQATIKEFTLYQDPVQPNIRQAVATISFNFPVDPSSFLSHTTLMLQSLKEHQLIRNAQPYQLTVDYDKHHRTAYLHSENLALAKVAHYLTLTLDKGIKSSTGSATLAKTVRRNLLIPDSASYFKINKTIASIIRNEQDRPEQVLTIETTLGITEPELNKGLHFYLLPQNYPATALEPEKKDYQWQNPGEVTEAILKLAKPLTVQALPTDRNYATLHSFKFTAQTPQYIYLKIDKGCKSFGDFVLSQDYLAIIKVPEFPKEISFLHKGVLLALNAEEKLSVLLRGLSAVKFTIARVLPDSVNQLVTQTEGDFNNPYFINQSFNQQNISEIFSEIQRFDASDLTKQHYTAIDFAKYLSSATNSAGPRGLFLLQATGWDEEKNEALDVKSSRMILITDLGLIVKDNNDGSHDVFLQSITQGTPVTNARVALLGKNGLPVLTRMTDYQGRANFPSLKDFVDEQEPTVYLASFGSDVSFIPYNKANRQLNYSRFDIGGLYTNDQELAHLSAYLFTERGIYRPGDQVHVAMIVKQPYAKGQPAGLPLQLTVTDPRGNTIRDQKLTLDKYGLLSFDFATTTTSPTGQYFINLYLVKDSHPSSQIGSATIRLAEFQPDRMKISSSFSIPQTAGWLSPKDLSAKVSLWNLYGAPAVGRKVSAKLLLAPKALQFASYPDYVFVDPLLNPEKPAKIFTDLLADNKTDENGQAQFNLQLDRFDKATYQLTFFAEGFEAEGGRSVATQSTALVSPLPYIIGYKADGDLAYIKQNSQRVLRFIAVNPQLSQLAVDQLKVQLSSLHPVTTLIKKPDGTYQYQSIIQSTVINSQPFTIQGEGSDFSLPTQEIGDFALEVIDEKNNVLSRVKWSVVGTSQKPLAKNAELHVKLNQTEYKAGDDIELQITAPYTGSGLITIERDKIYATQWFKTESTTSMQKIHIPSSMEGNGYVNVTFVRDWGSPEIFTSPLSYSVVPFRLNHSNRDVHIQLTAPQQALPGEPFTIAYKTDKPGKIIIFAVDEGILQVSHYSTPDPLAFFFQKHALEVVTQQIVDQILPKFIQGREISAVGGDGGEALLANHLNPFKRKTDLPVVYWSGLMDTDSTTRQVSYQVPDYFNGSLRLMAVAVANDAVGSAEQVSEIRGNFIINPNVPTFVAPGDEFEVSVSIANNVKGSGSDLPVSVQLTTTSALEVVDDANSVVAINEGQEKTLRFKLKAKPLLGSQKIGFFVKSGNYSSKIDASLSVRPASAFTTTIQSGMTKEAQKVVDLRRELYPEYRKVEAAISASPLILVAGLERYLAGFPYGCTEQLTSEALPLLAMSGQNWFEKDLETINNKIATTVQMLSQRQMSNGGFSYWPGLGYNAANSFASVYAMHFLTEARAGGYTIPWDLYSAGLGYLRDLASQTPTDIEKARIQAYAIYLLTRNEIVTTNYLTNLQLYLEQNLPQVWRKDICSAYMAATYQLLQSSTEANQLINEYEPKAPSTPSTDFYSSSIANAQYLYLIAHHFPQRLETVGNQLVLNLVQAINSAEINTLLSGYSSLALGAYAKTHTMPNETQFSMSEIDTRRKEKTLTPQDKSFEKANVDVGTTKVSFNNPTKQNYFYQLTEAGFDKMLASEEVKQGIEIYREYRDQTGQSISNAVLGSEIEVHIQVRALTNTYLSNIAIVDLLPGGFEVVRDSVNKKNIDFAEEREDRMIFYTGLDTQAREIVYRIKATNTGNYTVPAIFAESMYDPNKHANGISSKIVVTK